MSDGVTLRRSEELAPAEQVALRALLDAAFAGDFSDDDWAHALGGTHAILTGPDGVIAHAAIVPRTLEVGPLRLEVGYVEAVAVLPDRQRTGLGAAVMQAVNAVIADRHPLGVLSTGEWRFYERCGWERWRGASWVRFPDGGRQRTPDDDDSLMVLRTPSSPPIDLAWELACGTRTGDVW